MKKYRALVGLNYTPADGKEEVRRERGDDVSDIPSDDLQGLLEMKPPAIEEYEADDKPATADPTQTSDKLTVPRLRPADSEPQ